MKKELYELLRDEDSLLSSSEMSFLDEVNTVINTKLRGAENCNLSDDDERAMEVRTKISALEKNIVLMLKLLKEGRSSRKKFINTYPKWKENREKCIAELHEIEKSLKSDRFNCNVSKLVGYCVSAAGGGISLVSAVLVPFTLGLTTPLAIGGAALTATGVTTALGTSIAEITLLKSKVDKAKELIEKDKDYFRGMGEWLIHATDLQESLSKILALDIVKDIFELVKKFVRDTISLTKQSQRKAAIEIGINSIIKELIPTFSPVMAQIKEIIYIITLLVIVFMLLLNTENRLIFDCISLTIRSILGIGSLVPGSFNILNLSKAFAANAAVAKNFSQAIARGAVAVVGIALDVVGIVFTSVDIHKGSLCPEAEKIAQAASSLREEADILAKVYKNISR